MDSEAELRIPVVAAVVTNKCSHESFTAVVIGFILYVFNQWIQTSYYHAGFVQILGIKKGTLICEKDREALAQPTIPRSPFALTASLDHLVMFASYIFLTLLSRTIASLEDARMENQEY